MTDNRKEPTFSTSTSAAADDTSSTRAVNSSTATTEAVGAQRKYSAPAPAPVVKSSPLLPLALLLALTGLGLAGYSYWQLSIAQQQASTTEKRLAILESRLALADDESTQSVATLQASLREAR